MKGLGFNLIFPYEATPEVFEEQKQLRIEEVAGLCGGEEVITAAYFRHGGAEAQDLAGDLGDALGGLGLGFLARKGSKLARQKRAGGLPKSMLLAVTANRLYAFDTSYRISTRRRERESGRPTEAMAWDRDDLRVEEGTSGVMSTLVIKPLDGGPVATVVGGSNVDDPWSAEVMNVLAGIPTAAVN